MRLRTTLVGLAGAALALGTLTASAQATPAGRRGWEFTGQVFFWQAACEAAGRAGLGRDWSDYDCRGAPWRDYELWALR